MRHDRALPLLFSSAFSALLWACAATATEPPVPKLTEGELARLIADGRALLDQGKPAEAEVLFVQAAAAEQGSLRTRMWVLRAWMDQGRSNDTLDALDELNHAGESGTEMTYLYGMAFARRAEGYLADGVTDSSVQNNFIDATDKLSQVARADAVRYHDAFLPLARAAWYVSDFETARWAADRVVELQAQSAPAWIQRGRIAMSQFGAQRELEPEGAAAQAFLEDAAHSFQRAVEVGANPADEAGERVLAEAALQLGHAYLWQGKAPEATDAYATAAAFDPEGFDYGGTSESLRNAKKPLDDDRPCGFRAMMEEANPRFAAHAAPEDPRAGTLLWWLGWARFVAADWNGSEEAFQAALARVPHFTNAWFYIGLARQYRKDSSGAIEAMHEGWDADPPSMVTTAAAAGGALRAFESLLAWCSEQEPPRNLDAAFLAEMLTQAMPNEPRHWNNLGLFLRDEGERLELEAYDKKAPEPDPALLADLYQRSLGAYQHALELNPRDPQLVNDTAVMLHYHLDTDPAEVEGMYRHALALAEELLSGDVGEDDRARYEQTEKDIAVNLKLLLEPEAERTAKAAEKAAEAEVTSPPGAAATASGGGPQ